MTTRKKFGPNRKRFQINIGLKRNHFRVIFDLVGIVVKNTHYLIRVPSLCYVCRILELGIIY